MITKIIRVPDITGERLFEIAHVLKTSQNKLALRAINYYLDRELYHDQKEMNCLSTGKDLQEK